MHANAPPSGARADAAPQFNLQEQQPQLVELFSTRYLELTHEAAAKTRKNSPEVEALNAMNEREKLAYTRDLFAFGIDNWFKEHNTCFMLQQHEHR
ncbi:hypothetical protein ON010_g15066 [Phytophthora cinnamomi]|nr:hypothetical protein ON010_g15066 [Phytophthora cinnamomi]